MLLCPKQTLAQNNGLVEYPLARHCNKERHSLAVSFVCRPVWLMGTWEQCRAPCFVFEGTTKMKCRPGNLAIQYNGRQRGTKHIMGEVEFKTTQNEMSYTCAAIK